LLFFQKVNKLPAEVVNWKAHDIKVIAMDTLDKSAADTLNAVAARLVHGFARVDVGPDHFRRQLPENHLGLFKKLDRVPLRFENNAGVHELRLSAKHLQHIERFVFAFGLAVDSVLENDHGVGADDQIGCAGVRLEARGDLLHFVESRFDHEIRGVWVIRGVQIFFVRRRNHLAFEANVLQNLLPSGRAARQNNALLLQDVLKRLQHGAIGPAQIIPGCK